MSAEPVYGAVPLTPSTEPGSQPSGEMTLVEHLLELRNRVIVCAIALVAGTAFSFIFWLTIVGWLLAPARESHPDFNLVVFSPTETFGVLFKIGLYGGLIIASPVWLYEIISFVVPGLTKAERKILLPGALGAVTFLAVGMAFAYFIILPASLNFLLDFGGDQFDPVIGAKQYMDFAIRIIFWVGVSFEMPMVIAIAARLGMVRARQLIGFWRYAIVIVFVIAAVVTPTPDPLTQSLVAGPLALLYIVGVLFAWLLQKPRPKPVEAE